MTTKTARFELINPYQKYGLKRKPTFNEILGLISEDQKLLRPFPDRTATQFRNSPQGSFFDGADHVELLKEQQNRVLDRQMRHMMLQKQSRENGQTYHLERHRDNSGGATPIETVQGDSGMMTPQSISSDVDFRTYLVREAEQRRRQEGQRQQEVGQRHSQAVNRLNDTLTHNMLNRGFTGLLGMPELEEVTQQNEGEPSDDELIPAEDTVRPYQKNIIYFNNDIEAMKQNERLSYTDLLFQLYVRGRLTDEINKRVEELPDEISKKMYLLTIVSDLIGDGTVENNWQIGIESNLLHSRIKEWRQIQRGGGRGMLRQFLASAGSAASSAVSAGLQEVGKGAVKGVISAMTGT